MIWITTLTAAAEAFISGIGKRASESAWRAHAEIGEAKNNRGSFAALNMTMQFGECASLWSKYRQLRRKSATRHDFHSYKWRRAMKNFETTSLRRG
jgi:hypothetical protein